MSVLFILGSGASVDSGLSTYRGLNCRDNFEEVNTNSSIEDVWRNISYLREELKNKIFGETYLCVDKILSVYSNSVILTQNIDGLIHNLKEDAEIVELHGNVEHMKCINCKSISMIKEDKLCPLCFSFCKPNVTLIGENLERNVEIKVNRLIKRKYKYVLVIGTSLQFPYLRKIINSSKSRGAQIIHINPDPNYTNITYVKKDYTCYIKTVKDSNVRKKEEFFCLSAAEGLNKFINEYCT
jgi:NAD-dependent SIR2 family protein deacetylase